MLRTKSAKMKRCPARPRLVVRPVPLTDGNASHHEGSMSDLTRPTRPIYRNIHVGQLVAYRLPAAGWVSILHRISGALLFLALPFLLYLFDRSLTSESARSTRSSRSRRSGSRSSSCSC